jgi:hypothetical protein
MPPESRFLARKGPPVHVGGGRPLVQDLVRLSADHLWGRCRGARPGGGASLRT